MYDEKQGVFHHQHDWHEPVINDPFKPLLRVDSDYLNTFQHRFTSLMYLYNNPCEMELIATHSQIVKAMKTLMTENIILFIAEKIPPLPGVYIIYDTKHKPIYVGKSNNLQKRLPQSLKQRGGSFFRFALTNNESDALIYEMYYMCLLQPAFNQSKWLSSDMPTISIEPIEFTQIVHKHQIA